MRRAEYLDRGGSPRLPNPTSFAFSFLRLSVKAGTVRYFYYKPGSIVKVGSAHITGRFHC